MSPTAEPNLFSGYIQEAIKECVRNAFRKDAEKIFEEKKRELIEDLERRKNEVVAGIVIEFMKVVNFESIGERLVITVRKKEYKDYSQ